MWHGYSGHSPVWCLIFVLIAGCLLFRLFWFPRCGYGRRRWHDGRFEAESILRRRLASGEISEAEYQQLKDALDK